MTGSAGREVTLPRGVEVDGSRDKRAALRALTGRDEEFLLDECRAMLPAERNSAALARCITSLGPGTEVTREDISSLCLGDRDALLLHLCAAVAGPRLNGIIECPDPDCAERSDVDLDIGDLLADGYDDVRDVYETSLVRDGETFLVRFTLPTGLDQERAAKLFLADADDPARHIVDALVEKVSSDAGPLARLPDDLVDDFGEVLEGLDPQAEVRLSVACPECDTRFSVLFDPGEFLFHEITTRSAGLYGEVHRLALHYNWREVDILDLPVDRRRLYLGLIADDLAERASA